MTVGLSPRLQRTVDRASRQVRMWPWHMQRATSTWTRANMRQRAEDLQATTQETWMLVGAMEDEREYTLSEVMELRNES